MTTAEEVPSVVPGAKPRTFINLEEYHRQAAITTQTELAALYEKLKTQQPPAYKHRLDQLSWVDHCTNLAMSVVPLVAVFIALVLAATVIPGRGAAAAPSLFTRNAPNIFAFMINKLYDTYVLVATWVVMFLIWIVSLSVAEWRRTSLNPFANHILFDTLLPVLLMWTAIGTIVVGVIYVFGGDESVDTLFQRFFAERAATLPPLAAAFAGPALSMLAPAWLVGWADCPIATFLGFCIGAYAVGILYWMVIGIFANHGTKEEAAIGAVVAAICAAALASSYFIGPHLAGLIALCIVLAANVCKLYVALSKVPVPQNDPSLWRRDTVDPIPAGAAPQ